MTGALIVTGASRGIGAATARLAAAAGWKVCVNFNRHAEEADGVVAAIRAAGGTAIAVSADMADEAAIVAMFARVDRELGALGGLVNNAGMLGGEHRIEDFDAASMRRLWDVNVVAYFLCAREAVRRMSTRHGGRGGVIVNQSSAAARLGAPGQYLDYAASKGAIDTFTLGLAREVAAEGVRVNAVRPGIIETEIHASGGQPDRAAQMAPLVPMRRAGSAEEVAEAIVWLLSDAASYITGAVIDATGGR